MVVGGRQICADGRFQWPWAHQEWVLERGNGILMYLHTSYKYDLLEFSKTPYSQDDNAEAQVAWPTHFQAACGVPIPFSLSHLPQCLVQTEDFFLPVLDSGGGGRDGPPGLGLEGFLQPHPEHGERR